MPWNLYSKKEIIISILYFIGHCHFVWCKTNSSCIKGWKGEKEFSVFVWIQQKARLDHNSPQISVHCVSCRGHRSRFEVLSIRTYPSEGNRLLIINPFRYTCTFSFHKTIKIKFHFLAYIFLHVNDHKKFNVPGTQMCFNAGCWFICINRTGSYGQK